MSKTIQDKGNSSVNCNVCLESMRSGNTLHKSGTGYLLTNYSIEFVGILNSERHICKECIEKIKSFSL